MSFDLNGKVVVVTGGGNGMGRELVLELLKRGAKVAALDISEKGLAETASLAGNPATLATWPLDITDRAAVEAIPGKAAEALGPVDGIINCAGIIQPFTPLAELGYDVIDRVLNVNLRGTLYMTKAFLPGLLERPEAFVCNVSSMGGFCPFPGQTMYGASKAAVKIMTEGLAAELKDTKVQVSVVFPGAIGTNITANSGVEMKIDRESAQAQHQVYPPDAAARDILNGVQRGLLHILVGRDAWFLDKLYRVAPRRAALWIAEKMKEI